MDSTSALGFFDLSGVPGGVAKIRSGRMCSLRTLRAAAACSSSFLLTWSLLSSAWNLVRSLGLFSPDICSPFQLFDPNLLLHHRAPQELPPASTNSHEKKYRTEMTSNMITYESAVSFSRLSMIFVFPSDTDNGSLIEPTLSAETAHPLV